jgi:hypothetical protein
MTILITASFSFEAESLEEGEAIVGTWTVTPGANLNGVSAMLSRTPGIPMPIGPTGNVGTALATAHARRTGTPPPPAPVRGVPPAVPFVQPRRTP